MRTPILSAGDRPRLNPRPDPRERPGPTVGVEGRDVRPAPRAMALASVRLCRWPERRSPWGLAVWAGRGGWATGVGSAVLVSLGAIAAMARLDAPVIAMPVTQAQSEMAAPDRADGDPWAADVCGRALATTISPILERPALGRSRWGIAIRRLGAHPVDWYTHAAEEYFTPASNTKLLVTAAALASLSPEFRFRTGVYAPGWAAPADWTPEAGALPAQLDELAIVGSGDPSLDDAALRSLGDRLAQQGLRQIRQLTIVDPRDRDGATVSSWEWGDTVYGYGMPATRAMVNENQIPLTILPTDAGQPAQVVWGTLGDRDPADPLGLNQSWAALGRSQWILEVQVRTSAPGTPTEIEAVRDPEGDRLRLVGQIPADRDPVVWSMAVRDPAAYFRDRTRIAFNAAGITMNRVATRLDAPSGTPLGPSVAILASPPLADLVTVTNRDSNNLYAEALLRAIARYGPTSMEGGTQNFDPAHDRAAHPNRARDPWESERDPRTRGDQGLGNPIGNPISLAVAIAHLQTTLERLGVDPTGYRLADGSGLSRQNLISPRSLLQLLNAGFDPAPAATHWRSSLPVGGTTGTLTRRFSDPSLSGRVIAKTGTLTGVSALSGYVLPTAQFPDPIAFSIIVERSPESASTLRGAIDEMVGLIVSAQDQCVPE